VLIGEDREMDQGDDDCESEGDEAARPRAQFKLSYSASSFGDMDDARSASTIDDDFNGDLVNLNEPLTKPSLPRLPRNPQKT